MTTIRKASEVGAALGAALLAVLVPKCPVCVAAWLMALGLGAGVSHGAAPFVRPAAFTLAGLGGLALALAVWRRRSRRAPCCRR